MDELVKNLVNLANKFGAGIEDNLVELPVYNKIGSSFVQFIVSHRLVPFIRLLILNIVEEDKWFIGFERTERYLSGEDEEEPSELVSVFGQSVVSRIFSRDQMFNFILAKCHFPQVIISDPADWSDEDQVFVSRIPLRREGEFDVPDDEIILSKSIIFCSKVIFVNKKYAKKVSDLLSFHTSEFDAMIERYKDEATIPHQIYLEWLLEYLPGRIHIRSLGKY